MSDTNGTAWGHGSRYYADEAGPLTRSNRNELSQFEKKWANLLNAALPGARDAVDRTYRQWNGILRDHIRAETALRLTVGSDTQAVPVKIVDGMPRPFAQALEQFEGLETLLLNRPLIEGAARGTEFLKDEFGAVLGLLGDDENLAQPGDFAKVAATAQSLVKALDKIEALKRIVGCEEDVLGAYFFRIPEIRLYWVPIGIVASMLAIPAEALTVVVLAHELAHAYTHRGRDIDNEVWETAAFAQTDLAIVEGLAQFYTQTVCALLEPRFPAARKAFEALLAKQSGPYTAHREWVANEERGGEIVRVTMIECRSRGLRSAGEFRAALDRHREQVKGRARPRPVSA